MFVTTRVSRPFSAVLYGKPKIGKTTLAAECEGAVLIDFENGSAFIDGIPKANCSSTNEFRDVCKALINADNIEQDGKKFPVKTIIIDSLSSLQTILSREICADESKDKLEDFGYGKGYGELFARMEKFILTVKAFLNKGKNVILIAHQTENKINDLLIGEHSQFSLSVPRKEIAEKITSQFDAILYMKTAVKIDKETNVVAQSESRFIMTRGHPGAILGCRYDKMPDIYSVEKQGQNAKFWELLK